MQQPLRAYPVVMNHEQQAVTAQHEAVVDVEDMREQIYELMEAANSAVLHEVLAFVKTIREARPESFDAALLSLPSAADTIERGLRDYVKGRVLPAGALDTLLKNLRDQKA